MQELAKKSSKVKRPCRGKGFPVSGTKAMLIDRLTGKVMTGKREGSGQAAEPNKGCFSALYDTFTKTLPKFVLSTTLPKYCFQAHYRPRQVEYNSHTIRPCSTACGTELKEKAK